MQIACYIQHDATFRRVQETLESEGFGCQRFQTDMALVRAVRTGMYQLTLMDSGGAQVLYPWLHCCASARVPVMMLCENRDVNAVIHAFEAGVDDVMHGVFEPKELIARVGAVMRRYRRNEGTDVIEMHGFRLDYTATAVHDRGVQIKLTPKEFKLAWLLFSFAGTSLSREKISLAVWGVSSELGNRTFEQHIYKLRKKLGLTKERGVWIQSIYNEGVCLRLPEASKAAVTMRPETLEENHLMFPAPARAATTANLSH